MLAFMITQKFLILEILSNRKMVLFRKSKHIEYLEMVNNNFKITTELIYIKNVSFSNFIANLYPAFSISLIISLLSE
jgi:hypothetical protein